MQQLQPAIVAASLGLPGIHGISQRLGEAACQGFRGVEIIDDDIDSYAVQLPGGVEIDDNRLSAAAMVNTACKKLGLTVITLQPFRFYEGLINRNEHARMITKLKLWLKICQALETTIIQIPTNWLAQGTTADPDLIVTDLREIADLGLAQNPVIRFAYEAVAWGTHYDTWQGSWELVKRVDRPNFGLCLDTFHIACRVWGDPLSPSGKTSNADQDLEVSMKELVAEVDVDKVFYVQIGDAERLNGILDSKHPYHSLQRAPRMSWSRNARLFPFEEHLGGVLPIERVSRTIVCELGYKGWLSLELFSRKLREPDPNLPKEYAIRAATRGRNFLGSLG